jgi:hypothetical protein
MTLLQSDPVLDGQIIEPERLADLINGFHVEPRCRVCRNTALSRKVNSLLTTGNSYAMVLRSIGEDNGKLDERDRVTIDSIRNHTKRHFPVQNAAKATYRAILEQRAKQSGVDFVEGVGTAITPMAFLETVMVKSYESLVDSDTKVDVRTGMIAAGQLHAMIESLASGTSMADMLVKIDRVIKAVKSTVPESMWPEIVRKIEEDGETPEPKDDETGFFDSDDDPFDGESESDAVGD